MVIVVLREQPPAKLSPLFEVGFVPFGRTFLCNLKGVIAVLKILQLFLITTFGVAGEFSFL